MTPPVKIERAPTPGSRAWLPASWLISIRLAAALGASVVLTDCNASTGNVSDAAQDSPRTVSASNALANAPGGDWFVDRAEASGLRFFHRTGSNGGFYIPEIMGSGVGLLDFDNDGDLDVYFAQGGTLAPAKTAGPQAGPAAIAGGTLFRNDLSFTNDGTRLLQFTDVTAASRIAPTGYGMGVATGDIDNDGWTDLYLTAFGRNQLWRNNGNGTFSDISTRSGTDAAGWSVSASFSDYDRDGWLDLYVGHYLQYSIDADQPCAGPTGARDYCAPQVYRPQRDRLYRNNRNGTFADVTATSLRSTDVGPALGVISADLDGDGWLDIYVANDSQDNLLWMNMQDGTFRNTALRAGAAITADGRAEASMGVDAGDFDNDGDDDLVMTELNGEGVNLYVNKGDATFADRSAASGLGPATTSFTGFGTRWLDVDNDGWLDLLTVNGMVRRMDERAVPAVIGASPFPYDQRRRLLMNTRDGRFEDASERAGAVFGLSEVGRGAAFGDIDNDGDTDVVVSNGGGPARLLVNTVGARQHWIGLRLAGPAALGARVTVVRQDGRTLTRRAHTDGSYGSASDPRVLVGLGESPAPVTVRVRWPNGRTREWREVPAGRYTTLSEDAGR
jgi:hypothetical protein